ncbi:MAG TPA: hypothetical protein VFU31_14240 [Candidatus Binatia bacterium]|nr:hypothetical protein [Candidatus Binatia bacterium]
MDLKIKLLQLPEGENFLVVIAHGLIDSEGLDQILRKIAATTQSLLECKVLIDLEEASLELQSPVIRRLVNRIEPDLRRRHLKFALVSSAEVDEGPRVLGDSLSKLGLTAAVFVDIKHAAVWLSDASRRRKL